MGTAEHPRINGAVASWANFGFKIRGTDLAFETGDIAGLDWNDSLEPGKVPGKGSGKRGRTEGEYDADGSLSLYRHAYKKLMQALKSVAPKGKVGLVEFDIIAQWEPYTEDAEAVEDIMESRLVSCRITKRTNSMKPGSDAAVVEMPLDIMRVYDDGTCLIGDE